MAGRPARRPSSRSTRPPTSSTRRAGTYLRPRATYYASADDHVLRVRRPRRRSFPEPFVRGERSGDRASAGRVAADDEVEIARLQAVHQQKPHRRARCVTGREEPPSRSAAVRAMLPSRLEYRRCGTGLHLAHRVAQVGNADARDHHRVAKDEWRAGEAVEESNAGAEKNRRDVDVDLIEEAGIQ